MPLADFPQQLTQNHINPKTYTGYMNNTYPSSLNRLPFFEQQNNRLGKWDTKPDILNSTHHRIDQLVGTLYLEDRITENLAARLAGWRNPRSSRLSQHDPRRIRGIGDPDIELRERLHIGDLSPLMKVHKKPMKSRLVHCDSLGPFTELQVDRSSFYCSYRNKI